MNINVTTLDDRNLLVNTEFIELLEANRLLSAQNLWDLESTPVKRFVKDRGTDRLFLNSEKDGKPVETYIKRYLKAPIKQIFKNLFSLKIYQNNGIKEWESILEFHRFNIPTITPIAAARVGSRTCNLTLGIENYVRASELILSQTITDTRKKNIINKIARLAARMHGYNMAHQDFYLVHIFIKEEMEDSLFLIDLQRVIKQKNLSSRWMVKDLSQFIFSAKPHLSDTEMELFKDTYINTYQEVANKILDSDRLFKASFIKAESIQNRENRKKGKQVS